MCSQCMEVVLCDTNLKSGDRQSVSNYPPIYLYQLGHGKLLKRLNQQISSNTSELYNILTILLAIWFSSTIFYLRFTDNSNP